MECFLLSTSAVDHSDQSAYNKDISNNNKNMYGDTKTKEDRLGKKKYESFEELFSIVFIILAIWFAYYYIPNKILCLN